MSTLKVDGIRSNSASSDAITLASDGTCTANLSNRQNPNLIINGNFVVAQRGVSSTSNGHQTVDRWQATNNGYDETFTQAQVDVASGTTPYTLGFRKAFSITNGNQTSGAQSSSYIFVYQKIEAQNIANSGWNYTDPNSFITLSFWIKSSVSQSFNGYIKAEDATYIYNFNTGTLTANTWTKVTKTIPGNSNLVFNNDVGNGMLLVLNPYLGTDYTDSGTSVNTWIPYVGASRSPVSTTTWWTTNDATFQITGVQLEVGSTASSFALESYADTLRKCQRYFYVLADQDGGSTQRPVANLQAYTTSFLYGVCDLPVEMRTPPSITSSSGTEYFLLYGGGGTTAVYAPQVYSARQSTSTVELQVISATTNIVAGRAYFMRTNNANAYVHFSAEL
jgi:hypothetical protein|tara:strand:+ start:618 stop:1793 length:1176 start_codon:yes stop_codon:yes gene_type:complete